MHTDARALESGTLLEGDLCVVGAGAAGISIALDWVGSGRRVLLLEAGGFSLDADVQDLNGGEIVGRDYYSLGSTRIRFFGGTTNHWSGWCAPLDPVDFEHRPWVPHSGWPIARSDLDPYYRRAHELVEIGSHRWDVGFWEEEKGTSALPFDGDRIRTKMWQFSPPTRFGPRYRDRIVGAEDVHLVTHANVTEISADRGASRVEGLRVRTLTGNEHQVRADRYVLACGAIQNARLLLASNGQEERGLGNHHDLVGRFFMEHLEVDSGHLALREPRALPMYRLRSPQTVARGHLALSEAVQQERRTLNGTVSLQPGRPSEAPDSRIESWPEEASRTIDRWEEREEASADEEASAPRFEPHSHYGLYTRIEQAPNPASRITLAEETDALGVPRVRLDWQLTELDNHSIRELQRAVGEEVGRIGLGRVRLLDWLTSDDPTWPSFLAGGWHHMGTARMAEDPEEGVVNANCRVHGIDNLHVAGSAVYATAGSANPTLTLVALSLRLSDHLKGELTG